mgnify:FL=1
MKNKALYLRLFLGLLNEGTKDTEESISSSVKILPVSFDSSESNEKTSVFAETRTSTEIINNSGFSELNRMLARRNIIDEEAEKDRVIEKLVYELEEELNLFDEENEEYSSAERKIIEIAHDYKMRILGEVIQHIYVRNFDNPLYLIGICRSLLRYDLEEVKPWGVAMLAGLLNHSDERVKEYTIQLIDNWSDVELLPLLKTLQVTTGWLKDYIKDVVENLERKNVLYQKII